MRTEYRLMQRTGRSYTSADVSRHATPVDAMAAAGHPDGNDWEDTPSGVLALRDDVRLVHYINDLPWMIVADRVAETDAERIELAVEMLMENGQYDGDHHKMWTIDQSLRILLGDEYEQAITEYCDGEDGPETYSWDVGIAP